MKRYRQSLWVLLKRYVLLTIGVLIGSVSVILFLTPFDIAPGGITGVAVLLNEVFRTPIGLMVFVLNIPILLIGARQLPGGWRVVVRTIYVIVLYTVFLDWLAQFLPATGLSDDRLLNALFGGILGGIGGGIVYRAGGTFGGTSTLALILQRRIGLPMSTTFLYTDILIIIAAGFVFGLEGALYAIVVLFVGGLATDYILEGPSVIRTGMIVTNHPKEVSDAIFQKLDRGVTAWDSKGMYTGETRTVLYVTITRSQVPDLRQIVSDVDPNAFMVIGQGHTAYGEGFRKVRA